MPKSLENKNYKQRTRFLEANILNLGYAQFDYCSDVGIPIIKSIHNDTQFIEDLNKYKLIGFNFAKTYKTPQIAGVHFFLHDYQFERVWNYPDRYPNMLSKFAYVLSPDFSPYADMPPVCQAFNIYRNRWLGAYWQEQGIKVIPTITAGSKELEDIALSGI